MHPQAPSQLANLRLDVDRDALGAVLDVVGARGWGGYAPVGPGVARDDGEADGVVEAFDAGLDPFAGAGGGVGEGEQEAALVVLLDVGRGESEGGGREFVEGSGGEVVEGSWSVLIDVYC
jgi:hypothetical protein